VQAITKEQAMYAIVTRRRMNQTRQQETRERAETDFFPKLRQAPGFVSLTLVHGEDGLTTGMVIWESQAQAEAFRAEAEQWSRTLGEFGHQLESTTRGEVMVHLTPAS
jgi:heme-degrading monooxygenase HmoA